MKKLFSLIVVATLCLFFGSAVMCGGQIEPSTDNLSLQRHRDSGPDVKDVASEEASPEASPDASINPFVWVQTSGNNSFVFGTNPQGTTIFANANAAGDLLVLAARSGEANGSIHPPTDTAGNTWTLAYDEPDNGTNDGHMVVYYAFNCKTSVAGNKITITSNTGVNDINDLVAVEYAGAATSNPLDAANAAFSTSGSPTSVPLTTTSPGDLLIGWTTSASAQLTPGATTPDKRYQTGSDLYEDGVAAGSGMINITSQPTDASFNAIAVAFKASGSVPPPDGGTEAEAGSDATDGGDADVDAADASDGTVEEGGGVGSGKTVLGFYAGYQTNLVSPANIDWAGLTHLGVAFYFFNGDCTLNQTIYQGSDASGAALASSLISNAHAHGVKVLAAIGGQGSQTCFEANTTASTLPGFVNTLTGVMNTNGYDGWDLDWEGLPSTDEAPMINLDQALRTAMPNAIITLDVSWENGNFPVDKSSYGIMSQYVDQINVMTYGMDGPWGWLSWHSSALFYSNGQAPSSIDNSTGMYLAGRVPAAKLGFGIGAFGVCIGPPVNAPLQQTGSASFNGDDNAMSYANITSLYQPFGTYNWDNSAMASYLSFTSATGPAGCGYISFDDANSIQAKGNYLKAHGLGGVIFWTIGESTINGNSNPLLDATNLYILH